MTKICLLKDKLCSKIFGWELFEKIIFFTFWTMWYQLRHVPIFQMACNLELKPHFHNNDEPWKKNWTFMYWKYPYRNHFIQKLTKNTQNQKIAYKIKVIWLGKVRYHSKIKLLSLFWFYEHFWTILKLMGLSMAFFSYKNYQ